ncbi:arrestin [Schizosaccharomyces japonicus yFS275]|uniref:Arrestin n=1 Tax=Schizosaccharomyces japonicus (strain yFS275 / FY16936) TaxID=402676 RepID=B6K6W6_SCHJY|nr:arrestin [Schizosaccharomyces japonicus yFS275]EEB09270.2 arrestin [Schizosaccharomyces japonicus yFS275]
MMRIRKKNIMDNRKEAIVTCYTPTYAVREKIQSLVMDPVLESDLVKLSLRFSSSVFHQETCIQGHINVNAPHGTEAIDLIRIKAYAIGVCERKFGAIDVFMCRDKLIQDRKYIVPNVLLQYADKDTNDYSIRIQSTTHLGVPFKIGLPEYIGPGSYKDKNIRVCYFVSVSLIFKHNETVHDIRTFKQIELYPTIPPSVTETKQMILSNETDCHPNVKNSKTATIVARLYRTAYMSGDPIAVQLRIQNASDKRLTRLKLTLKRNLLVFTNSRIRNSEGRCTSSGVIKKQKTETIKSETINTRKNNPYNWHGVPPSNEQDIECHIWIPKNACTIEVGADFEVRYSLNVEIGSCLKTISSISIPVRIIPRMSLLCSSFHYPFLTPLQNMLKNRPVLTDTSLMDEVDTNQQASLSSWTGSSSRLQTCQSLFCI